MFLSSLCYPRTLRSHADQLWETEKNPQINTWRVNGGEVVRVVDNEIVVKNLEILVLILFTMAKR